MPSPASLRQQSRSAATDLGAVRQLVLRDLQCVFGGAYSAVHEDAAQHAIEVVLRRGLDTFDERGVDGYCIAVARHYVGREHRRHGVRRAEIEHADAITTAGDGFDDVIELNDLLGRVSALRPTQRTAMTARMLGLSFAQIQEATGRSYTWVNKHTVKGRAALRAAA